MSHALCYLISRTTFCGWYYGFYSRRNRGSEKIRGLLASSVRKRQTSLLHRDLSTSCLVFKFNGIKHILNTFILLFVITKLTDDGQRIL